jgi:hypothetical protein
MDLFVCSFSSKVENLKISQRLLDFWGGETIQQNYKGF